MAVVDAGAVPLAGNGREVGGVPAGSRAENSGLLGEVKRSERENTKDISSDEMKGRRNGWQQICNWWVLTRTDVSTVATGNRRQRLRLNARRIHPPGRPHGNNGKPSKLTHEGGSSDADNVVIAPSPIYALDVRAPPLYYTHNSLGISMTSTSTPSQLLQLPRLFLQCLCITWKWLAVHPSDSS